jgi:hypothetical protein
MPGMMYHGIASLLLLLQTEVVFSIVTIVHKKADCIRDFENC